MSSSHHHLLDSDHNSESLTIQASRGATTGTSGGRRPKPTARTISSSRPPSVPARPINSSSQGRHRRRRVVVARHLDDARAGGDRRVVVERGIRGQKNEEQRDEATEGSKHGFLLSVLVS